MSKANKQTTTTTPAPHPMEPANNDQKLVKLVNEALMYEQWGIEYGNRGEALAHLSRQVFPARYGRDDLANGWQRWQNEQVAKEEEAFAEMTVTPAASVAGLAVKLRLLERDTEHRQTSMYMIALFRSALADAERLARKGGAS